MQPTPLCTRSWHLNVVILLFNCALYLNHQSNIPSGSSNCQFQRCQRMELVGLGPLGCMLTCCISVQHCVDHCVKGRLALQSSGNLKRVPVPLVVLTNRFFISDEHAYTRLTSHACKAAHELCEIFKRIHELPHHSPKQRWGVQSGNKSCDTASKPTHSHTQQYTLNPQPVVAITIDFPNSP